MACAEKIKWYDTQEWYYEMSIIWILMEKSLVKCATFTKMD